MPLGDFVEAGTTPRPRRIGRTLRFVSGVGATYFFVWNFTEYGKIVDGGSVNIGPLVGTFFAWWWLSDAFTVGFGLKWGRWPQIVSFAAGLGLLAYGLVVGDVEWWSPLLSGAFVMTQFFYGFIGPSFILTAWFAVPG